MVGSLAIEKRQVNSMLKIQEEKQKWQIISNKMESNQEHDIIHNLEKWILKWPRNQNQN